MRLSFSTIFVSVLRVSISVASVTIACESCEPDILFFITFHTLFYSLRSDTHFARTWLCYSEPRTFFFLFLFYYICVFYYIIFLNMPKSDNNSRYLSWMLNFLLFFDTLLYLADQTSKGFTFAHNTLLPSIFFTEFSYKYYNAIPIYFSATFDIVQQLV